jgi:hypothetical protein
MPKPSLRNTKSANFNMVAAVMAAVVMMVVGSTVVVEMGMRAEKAVEAAAMQIESQRTIRLQLLLLQTKRPLTLDLNNLQIVLLHLVQQLERPINIMMCLMT